ncbi:hypothetical protein HOH87_06015 [bacterium]|nr:hypothetical protein [bacterium]
MLKAIFGSKVTQPVIPQRQPVQQVRNPHHSVNENRESEHSISDATNGGYNHLNYGEQAPRGDVSEPLTGYLTHRGDKPSDAYLDKRSMKERFPLVNFLKSDSDEDVVYPGSSESQWAYDGSSVDTSTYPVMTNIYSTPRTTMGVTPSPVPIGDLPPMVIESDVSRVPSVENHPTYTGVGTPRDGIKHPVRMILSAIATATQTSKPVTKPT